MNSVLSKLVGTDEETKKALSSIQATVDKIADTQKSMLSMQEKLAKRAAQDKKRDSGDKGIMGMFKKQEEDNKKKESWWQKLLKMLGPLLSAGGMGLLKALGLGGLVKIFTAKFWTDLFGKGLKALFGKDGLFAKVWKGAFGKDGWAKKAWTKAFGKGGWARNAWTKAFGKGGWAQKTWAGAFGKGGWASKALGGLAKTGAGQAILKALAPITGFFVSLGAGGGAKGLLGGAKGILGGIGKKFGGKILPGLGALIESVSVFKETGDVGQGAAAGGGAFAGGLGGAKLGAAIGTMIAPGIGTAIGGFLGGVGGTIIGSELGQGLYKMIAENPAVIAIGDFFKGYFKGVVDTFKETWESFTGMMSTLGKALSRFNEEVIMPFFQSIGDFFKNAWESYVNAVKTVTTAITDFVTGAWEAYTGAIKKVTDFIGGIFQPVIEGISGFLEDTLGPTLDKIQEFLKPIIDPLKQLATQILDPLVKAFEAVKEAIQGLINMIPGFGPDGFQMPTGEEVGEAVSGFFLNPFKNVFDNVNTALSDYAEGGDKPEEEETPTETPDETPEDEDALPQLGQQPSDAAKITPKPETEPEVETKPESEEPNRATKAFTLPSLPEISVPDLDLPEFDTEKMSDTLKRLDEVLPDFPMVGGYPQFEFPGSDEMTEDVSDISKALQILLKMEATKNPEGFQQASMSLGFQSGGMIPTMLEPGEAVFGPGSWSPGLAAMNSQFPRFQTGGIVPGTGTGDIYGPVGLAPGSFVLNRNATSMLGLQNGGEVPQTKASGARSAPSQITPDAETEKKETEAAAKMEEANTAGADAIIAAAEQSVGIYKGVSVMCARSTRDVLRLAGHPAADKSTQSGDLDVPVGYAVNGMDLAGSFAGTDMGTPYNDPRQAPPGSVLLWRGTYDVAKYGPDAITHVGLKGKGSDMYHHGTSPGWRKDRMANYMPDLAVDLNGEATGDPSSISRTGGDGQTGGGSTASTGTNLIAQLSGLGEAGAAMAGVFEIFNEVMGEDASALQQALGLTTAVAEQVVADDKLQTNVTTTASTPGGNFGESSLIKALNDAGITNKNERAMFLSQMAHESGNFQYDEEIHDGSNYEGRSDLGNTQAGDGKRYKGRGYIQITGRANYKKYGQLVGQDLEGNPELAKDPNIAAAVALAYWNDRVDRKAAQKGDIKTVTYNINGGYNGLQDRITKFDQYKAKGLQTGGVVNMKPINNTKFLEANDRFAEKMAKGQQPVVVPVPMGGGGGQPQQVVKNPGTQTAPPTLPDGPSSIQSAEYFYRLNMGSVF